MACTGAARGGCGDGHVVGVRCGRGRGQMTRSPWRSCAPREGGGPRPSPNQENSPRGFEFQGQKQDPENGTDLCGHILVWARFGAQIPGAFCGPEKPFPVRFSGVLATERCDIFEPGNASACPFACPWACPPLPHVARRASRCASPTTRSGPSPEPAFGAGSCETGATSSSVFHRIRVRRHHNTTPLARYRVDSQMPRTCAWDSNAHGGLECRLPARAQHRWVAPTRKADTGETQCTMGEPCATSLPPLSRTVMLLHTGASRPPGSFQACRPSVMSSPHRRGARVSTLPALSSDTPQDPGHGEQ